MWLVAVEAPTPQDGEQAVILAVIGAVSALLVAAVGGFFTYRTAKANRSSPPPVTPLTPALDTKAYERIAVVERRMDDNDERDEVQDRRIDQIERFLDLDNPRWRGPQ